MLTHYRRLGGGWPGSRDAHSLPSFGWRVARVSGCSLTTVVWVPQCLASEAWERAIQWVCQRATYSFLMARGLVCYRQCGDFHLSR